MGTGNNESLDWGRFPAPTFRGGGAKNRWSRWYEKTFYYQGGRSGDHAIRFPLDILFRMYRSFGPCVRDCRLRFLPVHPGNRSTPRCNGWREYHCDQKFRIRSGLTGREDRHHRYVDKTGQCSPHYRFRYRVARSVLFRLAPSRCLVLLHIHSGRNVSLSLHDSPVDEGHDHCAVTAPSLSRVPYSLRGHKEVIEKRGGAGMARVLAGPRVTVQS